MAKDLSPLQDPDNLPLPPRKRRISAKVKAAIQLRVKEAKPWAECAKTVGMSEAGIHKARKQQHVIDHQRAVEAVYIQEVEAMRAPYKARAFEVAADLMENAKSESTKARMVEFLAGERKQTSVNVQVNNNLAPSEGYEYVRPGAQIVDITPSTDEPTVVPDPSEPSK